VEVLKQRAGRLRRIQDKPPCRTAATEPAASTAVAPLNLKPLAMTHWHDTMVEQPETDGAVYATGWTISGLAVLAAIVAVWILGI
jgi:hypothetical protein